VTYTRINNICDDRSATAIHYYPPCYLMVSTYIHTSSSTIHHTWLAQWASSYDSIRAHHHTNYWC